MKKLLILSLAALAVLLAPAAANAADRDNQAPSVYISYYSPADEVGASLLVGVVTSDNDRVAKVEYLVDGQVLATSTEAPWDRELDTSEIAEGVHQLQARSYDPTGNNGITIAYEFTVDHTAPAVTLEEPLEATNADRPGFTFASASPDFEAAGCVIERPDESRDYIYCEPGEEYSEAVPGEGEWDFLVYARDRAGNRSVTRHRFIVDRTLPEAEFTSGPAEGAKLEAGKATFAWSASDDLALTQTCSWDGAAESPCAGTETRELTPGPHTFRVLVTDAAGNRRTLRRSIEVKGPEGPGPDEPGAGRDRTAPVVLLKAPKQRLKALRKGLKVRVRCSEACAGRIVAKASRGIRFRARVSLTGPGSLRIKLKPTAKTTKRLRTLDRTLKLDLTSHLADPSGNATVFSLKTKTRP